MDFKSLVDELRLTLQVQIAQTMISLASYHKCQMLDGVNQYQVGTP